MKTFFLTLILAHSVTALANTHDDITPITLIPSDSVITVPLNQTIEVGQYTIPMGGMTYSDPNSNITAHSIACYLRFSPVSYTRSLVGRLIIPIQDNPSQSMVSGMRTAYDSRDTVHFPQNLTMQTQMKLASDPSAGKPTTLNGQPVKIDLICDETIKGIVNTVNETIWVPAVSISTLRTLLENRGGSLTLSPPRPF